MVLVGSKFFDIRATKRCTEKKISTVTEAKRLPKRPGRSRRKNPAKLARTAVTMDGMSAPLQSESRQSIS